MRSASWVFLGLVACAAACQKSDKPEGTAERPGAGAVTAPGASATAADDGEGIATPEDFEDEAEQKITRQNADEELDKLEKEISN